MLNPMRIQKLAGAFVLVLSAMLSVAQAASAPKAKNIILMVADGTGFSCFDAASYFQHGRLGQQPYDHPTWVRYACRTTPLTRSGNPTGSEEQDKAIVYDPAKAWDKAKEAPVDANNKPAGTGPFKGYNFLKTTYTDSAAAASALASGVKTYNSAIGYANGPDPDGKPLMRQTIAELAKARGLSTGVITSVPWSHATPAATAGVHNDDRDHYYAIANEMLHSKHLDLIMGAGHPEFDNNAAPREPKKFSDYNYVGGFDTWEKLKAGTHPDRWTLVQTKAEFEALMSGPTPRKVIGTAQVATTLQQGRQTQDWNDDGYIDEVDPRLAPAYGDPLNATVPTLATMSRAALNVLNNRGTGFFLMIEGGAVDWANHANQGGRMIEEASDFLAALHAVNDWVNTYSSWDQTLVIVTADHETGLLWGPNSDRIAFDPIVNNGAGKMPGLRYNSNNHTNSLVPLFARGPGASLFESLLVGYDPIRGAYVDNTHIFDVMKRSLPNPKATANRPRRKSRSSN